MGDANLEPSKKRIKNINSTRHEKSPKISVFSPNTEKYGPEKTPYLDSFHEVQQTKTKADQNNNKIFD